MKKASLTKWHIKGPILLVTLLIIAALVAAFAWSHKATTDEMKAGESRAIKLLSAQDISFPPKHVNIIIHKSKRTLELYADGKLIQTYRTVFGGDPIGHKAVEGDNKTPEGKYTIVTRHRSRFHLFLGISYPNAADAKVGLDKKDISQSEYEAIVKAEAQGKQPPWKTKLGGAIGIHGGGILFDWTAGCIAVTDEAIEEIYALATHGTDVEILP